MVFRNIKGSIINNELKSDYDQKKQRWIFSTTITVVLPFLMTFIVGLYTNSIDFVLIFNQGDLVLLSYGITIPILFDIYELKYTKGPFFFCFCLCTMEIIFQTLTYALIKGSSGNELRIENVVLTIILLISSTLICNYSISLIYYFQLADKYSRETAQNKEVNYV